MTTTIITVDGPSGSGKTTLGRSLAVDFGLPLIDTGLFYRAVTVAAIRAGLDIENGERLGDLALSTEIAINTDPKDRGWTVRIDGLDGGEVLRDPAHATMLGRVSQTPAVRRALLPAQRQAGVHGGVAVGRDCGAIVFPRATVKFFLVAPAGVRVERRAAQLSEQRHDATLSSATADVVARDAIDKPSIEQPDGAFVIDTALMGVDEMVKHAHAICLQAGLSRSKET